MGDTAQEAIRSATGQFLPGRSGNPAGRPRGSRNRASLLVDMIDGAESEAIVRGVVDRALAGEWAAQRACFTRLVPPAREAPVAVALPPVASAADAAEAGAAVIAAAAAGEIAPGEAQKLMRLLSNQLQILAAAARAQGEAKVAPDGEPAAGPNSCISPVPSVVEACPEFRRRVPVPSADEACPDDGAPAATVRGTVAPYHGRREPVLADAPARATPRHDPTPSTSPRTFHPAPPDAPPTTPVPASPCIQPVPSVVEVPVPSLSRASSGGAGNGRPETVEARPRSGLVIVAAQPVGHGRPWWPFDAACADDGAPRSPGSWPMGAHRQDRPGDPSWLRAGQNMRIGSPTSAIACISPVLSEPPRGTGPPPGPGRLAAAAPRPIFWLWPYACIRPASAKGFVHCRPSGAGGRPPGIGDTAPVCRAGAWP